MAAAVVVAAVCLSAACGRQTAALPGLVTAANDGSGAPGDEAWLAAGLVPAASTGWAAMSRAALRDLHHLTPAPPISGGPAAGAGEAWELTWPRDAAFSVVALARTGHAAEALAGLAFLQRVQHPDGGFAARYQLDGQPPPDPRPDQLDGPGWALWALDAVSASADPQGRLLVLRSLRPLLDRATAFSVSRISPFTWLPAASPDYWEHPERELTLGVAAPLLAGLQAAARMYADLGDARGRLLASAAATRVASAIAGHFGPGGYQRYGDHGGVDAAVTFLAPPFVTFGDAPGVAAALRTYQRTAARSSGGLAPGADWRDDGVSWTPETALVALGAAATGDRTTAQRWLTWLDGHRVPWGSLPEKVRPDGGPAGPAPLAWTSALAVLTLQALDARARSGPALSSAAVAASLDRLHALGEFPTG